MNCPEQANIERQKIDEQLSSAAGECGKWGVTASRYGVTFGGEENALYLDCDGHTILNLLKNHLYIVIGKVCGM